MHVFHTCSYLQKHCCLAPFPIWDSSGGEDAPRNCPADGVKETNGGQQRTQQREKVGQGRVYWAFSNLSYYLQEHGGQERCFLKKGAYLQTKEAASTLSQMFHQRQFHYETLCENFTFSHSVL